MSDHPDSGVVRYDTLVRWWYLGWYVTSGIVHYHSVRVISHYRYVTYASVICAYLVYLGYTGTPPDTHIWTPILTLLSVHTWFLCGLYGVLNLYFHPWNSGILGYLGVYP